MGGVKKKKWGEGREKTVFNCHLKYLTPSLRLTKRELDDDFYQRDDTRLFKLLAVQ